MRCQNSKRLGFTLVELMIVVAITGLLASIAVPNFMSYSTKAKTRICYENLAQIESAKELWGLQNNKHTGDLPTDADIFGPTAYVRTKPQCPAGGTYDLHEIGTSATCTTPGHVWTNAPP
jgi:prepilin-type N-terminal cleavage/methylation domain-containing protein